MTENNDKIVSNDLDGQRVAVPESRQLDVLADLLTRRGAEVIRLPLISILDVEDAAPVEDWLRWFIKQTPDYLVVLTGEGLRRLHGFAHRATLHDDYITALDTTTKVCRGPKPGRVLREWGMRADLTGSTPTTAGMIDTLSRETLKGKTVGVQLYGQEPNQVLMDFLAEQGAEVRAVAPYRYAPDSDDAVVLDFITRLDEREVDAITFTSQPQFKRLQSLARKHGLEETLMEGLAESIVVAVGPVVADQLREAGVRVDIMPEGSYFMKPMVTALVNHLNNAK